MINTIFFHSIPIPIVLEKLISIPAPIPILLKKIFPIPDPIPIVKT